MEIIDPNQKREYESRNMHHHGQAPDAKGRILGGLILLIIGGLWLASKMGLYMPEWLFHWPTILVVIGLVGGARRNFRLGGWLIPILIGVLFWFEDWIPNLRHVILPVVVIVLGLGMILAPRRRREFCRMHAPEGGRSGFKPENPGVPPTESGSEILDSVSIFGSNKKRYSGTNFRGGESVSIFGGAEIDLSQADIQEPVKLEVVQIFGGTKLIIPPHWQVRSEMVSVFGSVEDTRTIRQEGTNPAKTIILEGFSFMGSIHIKSF